jgi:hypothetical protein
MQNQLTSVERLEEYAQLSAEDGALSCDAAEVIALAAGLATKCERQQHMEEYHPQPLVQRECTAVTKTRIRTISGSSSSSNNNSASIDAAELVAAGGAEWRPTHGAVEIKGLDLWYDSNSPTLRTLKNVTLSIKVRCASLGRNLHSMMLLVPRQLA